MWHRFTASAQQTVALAWEAAHETGEAIIFPRHLLAGLCRSSEGVAVKALCALGADVTAIAAAVAPSAKAPSMQELSLREAQFHTDAKSALVMAVEEARRMRHQYIGTEHILLGLLNSPQNLLLLNTAAMAQWGVQDVEREVLLLLTRDGKEN